MHRRLFLTYNFVFHDFSLSENCTLESKKMKEANLFEPDVCKERDDWKTEELHIC